MLVLANAQQYARRGGRADRAPVAWRQSEQGKSVQVPRGSPSTGRVPTPIKAEHDQRERSIVVFRKLRLELALWAGTTWSAAEGCGSRLRAHPRQRASVERSRPPCELRPEAARVAVCARNGPSLAKHVVRDDDRGTMRRTRYREGARPRAQRPPTARRTRARSRSALAKAGSADDR